MDGYNMHLPGIPELKEQKRLERAAAWRERNAKVQELRAIRKQIGTEAFVRERLGGNLRVIDTASRRITHGWE